MWFRTNPYIPTDRLVSFYIFKLISQKKIIILKEELRYLFILDMLIGRIIHDIFFFKNTADERHAT